MAQDGSADGRVIVGGVQRDGDQAVRWREGRGRENLNEVYRALVGSTDVLRQATGVSADGRYIVGWGEQGGFV